MNKRATRDAARPEIGIPSDQLPEEAPPGVAGQRRAGGGVEGSAREAARGQARRANRSSHSPGDGRASQPRSG